MNKTNSIINSLIAITLLGVLALLVTYGVRYYNDSADVSRLANKQVIANDKTNNADRSVSKVQIIENPEKIESKATPQTNNQLINESVPVVNSPTVPIEKPKKKFISLFPSQKETHPAFTTIELNRDIIELSSGPQWTEVFSSKGLPVWVRGDMVKEYSRGYVEVIVPAANARSIPSTTSSAVIGSLSKGEVLKISRQQDGWIRLWSPIRFRAWVKTEEFER